MMASAGAAMGGGVARGAPVGGASRATLQGPAGVFTVLPGLEMKAGRDGGQCAIFLENGQVSAVHASLKLEGGQLLVRDEGSTGGTTINGHPVSPGAWTPLHGGDRVAFGPVELTVTLE